MKKFYIWLVVAAATHAIALCAAVFFQIWNAGNIVKPKIVSVTLVSLPAPAGGTQELSDGEGDAEEIPVQVISPPTPSPSVEQKVQKPVVKEPQQKPPQLLSPKIVVEKAPASQPADNQLQKALERMKQLVDQKTPPPQPSSVSTLNSALDKLQQKVKSAGAGNGGGQVAEVLAVVELQKATRQQSLQLFSKTGSFPEHCSKTVVVRRFMFALISFLTGRLVRLFLTGEPSVNT